MRIKQGVIYIAERLSVNLIFIVTFLSTFYILVMLIPAGFLYSDKTYMQYEYPDYFDKSDVENIKFFKNGTLPQYNVLTLNFKPDGVNFKFKIYWWDKIGFYHVTWEWLVFESVHRMDIEQDTDNFLTKSELIANWDSDYNASIFYPVKCNHITTKVWITDSNSTRNDIAEAWDDGSVDIGMGFGFDDISTTLSAWDLIGRLLTLQAIEFGPWYIQLIINLPIYTTIAYLIYRLILLAIPFVGGGA